MMQFTSSLFEHTSINSLVNLKDKGQQPNIVHIEHFILDFNSDHLMCVTVGFLSIFCSEIDQHLMQ